MIGKVTLAAKEAIGQGAGVGAGAVELVVEHHLGVAFRNRDNGSDYFFSAEIAIVVDSHAPERSVGRLLHDSGSRFRMLRERHGVERLLAAQRVAFAAVDFSFKLHPCFRPVDKVERAAFHCAAPYHYAEVPIVVRGGVVSLGICRVAISVDNAQSYGQFLTGGVRAVGVYDRSLILESVERIG